MFNAKKTSLYKEYCDMKEEILKHKWYESEKAGRDVGFSWALINWTLKFKTSWINKRRKTKS
jgi:hypothetical protein